ncbi:MAG: mechanosensitive ion channel [Candidatus Hydrogenedentes bacterium]|nr:mechanosensitive ion channel [Candidatus Hydrogenedentota bacterium]
MREFFGAKSIPRYVALCCAALLAHASFAQERPEAPADPHAQVRAQLEQRIEEYDQKIQQAEAYATEERAAQLGVSVQELTDQALRLRETRSVFETHGDAIDILQETKRSMAAVDAEIASYAGLPEPPPYTPWFVDTFRDAVDARTTQREIAQRSLDQAKDQATTAAQELNAREGEYSVANEKFTMNKDEGQRPALEWAVQVALAKRELWQARKNAADFAIEVTQARVELRDKELDLADRKRKDAESKISYRPDDLEARRKEIAAEREALEKERADADVQRDKSRKKLEDARVALDSSIEDEEYAVNQAAVDLRRVEAEAAQEKSLLLRERMDTLYHITELWSARYALHTEPKKFPLRQQRERLDDYVKSLEASRQTQELREDVLRAEVRELGERLSQMQQSVNTLDNTQAFLKLRTGQLDQIALAVAANDRAEKLTKRVLAEIAEVEQRQSLGERLQQFGETAQRIWDRELFSIDEQPLTIKKIFIALLILAVGLTLTRLITRMLRRALNARQHIDRTAAATIERVLHYGLIAMIVLFALNTVNIPLTVFTFFGGALAIGVGFGAQTLINNFISGLILMAERPIKIGDIVEVDGQRGLVAEIGARCSRIATYTGIDILVPNSVLLERNVVNWTYNDSKARHSLTVKVAHETDTRDATRLIEKALNSHGQVLKTPEPSVLFTEILDNAFVFEVNFWLDLRATPDGRIVSSDLRHMIDGAFRDAGIHFVSAPKAAVSSSSIERAKESSE